MYTYRLIGPIWPNFTKKISERTKVGPFYKICGNDAVEDWPEHIKKFTYSLFKGKHKAMIGQDKTIKKR